MNSGQDGHPVIASPQKVEVPLRHLIARDTWIDDDSKTGPAGARLKGMSVPSEVTSDLKVGPHQLIVTAEGDTLLRDGAE